MNSVRMDLIPESDIDEEMCVERPLGERRDPEGQENESDE